MNNLEGKIVLITGGGRGLGAMTCHTLAEAGAVVIPADIRADLAEAVAAELRSKGKTAVSLRLDVTNQEQVAEAVRQIVTDFGRIDVLINNAGTDVTRSIEELAIDDWDQVLAVNLRGPFILSKAVLPFMKRHGRGHIINIVSTAAKRAWANASAYHASKWGLLGLSYALHVEGRLYNVKVTALVAGGMRTPFLLERFPDIDLETLQDPKNVADTIRFVLMQPDESVIAEIMVLPMRETSWP
ncbi:MAG TPA: SDR family oxidoreductase [Anaerolineae bacterium]|nr:SDR family oxidoreductase [Anaerolineae bacterium]HMR66197.1 SDR family oxidoreductase [Anaerolineae bacterium]